MKLVSNKGNPEMNDTSDFLKEELYCHFYFGLTEVWMGRDVMAKDDEVM